MAESFSAGWSQRYFGDALKSFTKTAEWVHAISGMGTFFAIITDALGARIPHFTLWALAAVSFFLVVVWSLSNTGHIARQTAQRIMGVTIFPAMVLAGLLATQTFLSTPSVLQTILSTVSQIEIDIKSLPGWERQIIQQVQQSTGASEQALMQRMTELQTAGMFSDRKMIYDELQSFAEQLNRVQAVEISTTDPQVRALLASADRDTANGEFGQARLKTRQAAEMERMAALDYTSRSVAAANAAANALEHSAWLAELTGQYIEAGRDYADGAKLISAVDPHRAWQLTRGQAHDFYEQGVKHHDEAAARQAVDLCTDLVMVAAQSHWSLDWQASKIDLDLANASLNAMLGTRTEPMPTLPPAPVPQRSVRPIHAARPGRPHWYPETRPVEIEPRPVAPSIHQEQSTQPSQTEGFFARLKNWAARNSNHDASKQDRQIIQTPLSSGASTPRLNSVQPPQAPERHRTHEGTVSHRHALNP